MRNRASTPATSYGESTECRRGFILNYFGEDAPERCGYCDNCERADPQGEDVRVEEAQGTGADTPEPEAEQPSPLQSRVVNKEWGPGMVMSHDEGAVTVLFESEGYKTLSVDLVQEKDLQESVEL